VHLVLATQRASGALSDDIRANTALRIALRLHDHGESRDVVGDDSAARLPRRVAGRAVMRLGDDERITFQAAYSTPVLSEAVDAVTAAARREGRSPRRRPWCDPLPPLVTAGSVMHEIGDTVDADSTSLLLGMVDDTDAQRRRPLRWHPDDGALLLLGGSGTGLTSALRLIAHQFGVTGSPPPCLVIDPSLDEVALHRVLGAAAVDPTAVLLVDRLDLVRSRLEREGREMHLEMLVHALARQQGIVVATSSLAAVPSSFLPRCTTRWATHLHDPVDLTGLGLRPDDNPPALPGRIVIGGTGPDAALSAQLVLEPHGGCSPKSPSRTDRRWRHRPGNGLVIGTDLATGDAVSLCVEDGEHVMVSGGRRTGRTTALTALTGAWPTARPNGVVVTADGQGAGGRRCSAIEAIVASAVDNAANSRPTLLVIDDADAVDDETGVLRSLLDARLPLLTLAIALHPGALRGRYGHWTQEVRRHRTGLALLGGDDDGDTWGVVLPRRLPLAPAPGRALVVRRGIVDELIGPRIVLVDDVRSHSPDGRARREPRGPRQ
jgi:S-DNA-T family DNA segregation ATPase FtsK/SpoIIIE